MGQKQTCAAHKPMSAKCHKRTLSASSEPALFSLDLAKLAKKFARRTFQFNFNQVIGPFCFAPPVNDHVGNRGGGYETGRSPTL
jgi:hypothetical protein